MQKFRLKQFILVVLFAVSAVGCAPKSHNDGTHRSGNDGDLSGPAPKDDGHLLSTESGKKTDNKNGSAPKKPKISKPRPKPGPDFDATIRPDHVEERAGAPRKIHIDVFYTRSGQDLPISNLNFNMSPELKSIDNSTLACEPGGSKMDLSASLDNKYYRISGHYRLYTIKFSAVCGRNYQLRFDQETLGGQVVSIVETIERAKARLEAEIGLGFWTEHIRVNYPARSNYYDLGEVNVTRGSQYEAVAHELGHAIYDLGGIGAFGLGVGTQASVTAKTGSKIHLMDRCYSEDLAYSEGWATFFAGWLYLNPKDTDAHFTQLVPRRSPIQIENVPADVCKGPTNEWHVASYFWHLYEQSQPEKSLALTMGQIWSALTGHEPKTAREAAALIAEKLGTTPAEKQRLTAAWHQAFGSVESSRF